MNDANTSSCPLRPLWLGLFLAVSLLVGFTVKEVVPQYSVDVQHHRGGAWRDNPSFLIGDCPYYRATLISLIEDWDLNVRNNIEPMQYKVAWNVAAGPDGIFYPKHSILMPIVAIPFYLVAGDMGLLAFNVAQLVAVLVLMWWGARRYTSDVIALAVIYWFAFGTMLRPAAYNFAPDVFSTLVVTAGCVAVLNQRAALGGLLFGLAVWAKVTNVTLLPLPVLYFLLHRDGAGVLRYGVAASLPLLIVAGLNYHMFGSPLLTPYDRMVSALPDGDAVTVAPSHRDLFTTPFLSGMWKELSEPTHGLLVWCPPLLLAPFGLYFLVRRAPADALLIGGLCFAQLATFATFRGWQNGTYGPRFLLSVVTLGALLVAPLADRILRRRRLPAGRAGDGHNH